jgi:exopolysaccharide biosynthesis polyprenyl glycosylphosphotransferase
MIAIFLDLAIVGISFVIAYTEKAAMPGSLASLSKIQDYGWVFLLYLILVMTALYLSGFYTFGRTLTRTEIVLGVTKSVGVAFALLVLILFLFKEHEISRLLLALFGLNNALLLIMVKLGFRAVTGKLQEHGYNTINAILIGTGETAERLIRSLTKQSDLGYRIAGALDPDPNRVGQKIAGIEILGTTEQLDQFLEEKNIDEVFVTVPPNDIKDMNRLMYLCEEVGVRFSLCADWVKPHIAKTSVRTFLDFPLITYTATPTAFGELLIKAIMDRVAAFLLLMLISPILLLIALAIRLSGPGTIVFKQLRAGLNGRPFHMLKFRTMVPDAEDRKKELAHLNEMDGPVFKISDDPRVTRVGRFLRRTSLDELPQLINVLRGDMSLVGPRPPVPAEVEKYERWQRRRLSMKPGITCYWQIAGRNEVSFDQWMELDLKYIDNWSLKLDLVILVKTIPVVLSGRGAS